MSNKVVNPKNSSGEQTDTIVRVRIASGSGLAAKDSNGKSDPFVKASIGGEKVHKTSVIKKTLDPVWSNESFDVCLTAHQYAQNATMNDAIDLRFEIFDKDLLKDEKMGDVSFMLSREILEKSGVNQEHIQEFDVALGSGKLSIGFTVLKRGYEYRLDKPELVELFQMTESSLPLFTNFTSKKQVAGGEYGWWQICAPINFAEEELTPDAHQQIFRAVCPTVIGKDGHQEITVETLTDSYEGEPDKFTPLRAMTDINRAADSHFHEWVRLHSLNYREPLVIAFMSTPEKVIQTAKARVGGELPVRFFTTGNLVLDDGEFYWRITTRYLCHLLWSHTMVAFDYESWHSSIHTVGEIPPTDSKITPEFNEKFKIHCQERDSDDMMNKIFRLTSWGRQM